jgi:cytochrome b subunit of formate dehydrogenase
MKNSIKKILKWTPTLAVSLMVITGASLSLMGNEQMVAASSKMACCDTWTFCHRLKYSSFSCSSIHKR